MNFKQWLLEAKDFIDPHSTIGHDPIGVTSGRYQDKPEDEGIMPSGFQHKIIPTDIEKQHSLTKNIKGAILEILKIVYDRNRRPEDRELVKKLALMTDKLDFAPLKRYMYVHVVSSWGKEVEITLWNKIKKLPILFMNDDIVNFNKNIRKLLDELQSSTYFLGNDSSLTIKLNQSGHALKIILTQIMGFLSRELLTRIKENLETLLLNIDHEFGLGVSEAIKKEVSKLRIKFHLNRPWKELLDFDMILEHANSMVFDKQLAWNMLSKISTEARYLFGADSQLDKLTYVMMKKLVRK